MKTTPRRFWGYGLFVVLGLAIVVSVVVGRRLVTQALLAPEGDMALFGTAVVTGEREVTVSVRWEWTRPNPRPGMADHIVVLGPTEWQTAQANLHEPIGEAPGGQVEFWTVIGGPNRVNELIGTWTTKAYAAVTPNVDGRMTIFINTEVPAKSGLPVTILYFTSDVYPVPPERWSTHPPTLLERVLIGLRVSETTRFSERSLTLTVTPWQPEVVIPPIEDDGYTPVQAYSNGVPAMEQVARDLFTDYLHHYLGPEHTDAMRLTDSTITGITIIDRAQNSFRFGVDFDVRPAQLATGWLAANGVAEFSGWIRGKFLQCDVTVTGDTCTMTLAGTGGK